MNLYSYYKNLSVPKKASLWYLVSNIFQKGISFALRRKNARDSLRDLLKRRDENDTKTQKANDQLPEEGGEIRLSSADPFAGRPRCSDVCPDDLYHDDQSVPV